MTASPSLNPTIYDGWHTYQGLMLTALQPLTPEQLALSAAPGLRTIGQIATHMIGARARWIHGLVENGGDALKELGTWDRPGMPTRQAPELVRGLEATWQAIQSAVVAWTPAEWQQTWPGQGSMPANVDRAWVIWHLIEHDLHHGGEVSILLGMHNLAAPDL